MLRELPWAALAFAVLGVLAVIQDLKVLRLLHQGDVAAVDFSSFFLLCGRVILVSLAVLWVLAGIAVGFWSRQPG